METLVAILLVLWLCVVTVRDAAAAAFGRDGGALLRWAAGRHDLHAPAIFRPIAVAAAASVPVLLLSIGLVGLWYPLQKSDDDALRCTSTPDPAIAACRLVDEADAPALLVKDIEPVGHVQRVRGVDGQTLGALLPGRDPSAFRRNVARLPPPQGGNHPEGTSEVQLAGHFSAQPDGPFLPLLPLLLLLPWLGASLAWGRRLREETQVPSSVSGALPVGVPTGPTRGPAASTPPVGARYASAWAPLATPLSVVLLAAPLVILGVLPPRLFEARSAWRLSAGLVDDALLIEGGVLLTIVTVLLLGVWARAVTARRAGTVYVELGADGVPRSSWQRVAARPSARVSLWATVPAKDSSEHDPDFDTIEVAWGGDVAEGHSDVPSQAVATEIRVQFFDGTVARLKRRG